MGEKIHSKLRLMQEKEKEINKEENFLQFSCLDRESWC
jgi:hypothetical protein